MDVVKIYIENLFSHERTEVSFPYPGIYRIEGPNGAGKSSLVVDSLLFALYGKTRGGSKLEEIVRRVPPHEERNGRPTPKTGKVQLTLCTPRGETFRITRTAGKRGEATAEINKDGKYVCVARGSSEVNKLVQERITGMSPQLLLSSMVIEQGGRGRFCHMTPTERARALYELLELEIFEQWEKKIREAKRKTEEEYEARRKLLAFLKSKRVSPRMIAEELKALEETLADLKKTEEEIVSLREQVTKAQQIQTHLTTIAQKIKELQEEKEKTEERLGVLQAEISKASEMVFRLTRGKITAIDQNTLPPLLNKLLKIKDHTVDQENALLEARALVEELKRAKEREKALMATTKKECPYCGQIIPDEKAEQLLTEERKQITALTNALARLFPTKGPEIPELERMMEKMMEKTTRTKKHLTQIINTLQGLSATTNEIAILTKEAEQIAKQQKSLEEEAKTLEKSLHEIQKYGTQKEGDATKLEVSQLEEKLRHLRTQKDNLLERKGELLKTLEEEEKRREELRRVATESRELYKRANRLGILERAVGKNGIPQIVIQGALAEIERTANEFLDLNRPLGLSVRLKYVAKKEEGNERLEIIPRLRGREADYRSFSGGEQSWIDLAIHLALAKLVRHQKGASVSTLVIDEATENLDSEGKRTFLQLLALLQTQFRKIFLLSHSQEFRDEFENVIVLQNRNGRTVVIDAPGFQKTKDVLAAKSRQNI